MYVNPDNPYLSLPSEPSGFSSSPSQDFAPYAPDEVIAPPTDRMPYPGPPRRSQVWMSPPPPFNPPSPEPPLPPFPAPPIDPSAALITPLVPMPMSAVAPRLGSQNEWPRQTAAVQTPTLRAVTEEGEGELEPQLADDLPPPPSMLLERDEDQNSDWPEEAEEEEEYDDAEDDTGNEDYSSGGDVDYQDAEEDEEEEWDPEVDEADNSRLRQRLSDRGRSSEESDLAEDEDLSDSYDDDDDEEEDAEEDSEEEQDAEEDDDYPSDSQPSQLSLVSEQDRVLQSTAADVDGGATSVAPTLTASLNRLKTLTRRKMMPAKIIDPHAQPSRFQKHKKRKQHGKHGKHGKRHKAHHAETDEEDVVRLQQVSHGLSDGAVMRSESLLLSSLTGDPPSLTSIEQLQDTNGLTKQVTH